jgi:hypothetical protein
VNESSCCFIALVAFGIVDVQILTILMLMLLYTLYAERVPHGRGDKGEWRRG